MTANMVLPHSKPKDSLFLNVLPPSRLGNGHASLESYDKAVRQTTNRNETQVPTEFSLVVLLSPNSRQHQKSNISILLGKKLRGFGKGFFNCFGGKLEKSYDEHKYPARGAVREIQEETGIHIPLEVMEDGFVGSLNFTFDDWEVNKSMKVYLYCVVVSLSSDDENNSLTPNGAIVIDPQSIRGCDEIEPTWFHNIFDIPLQQMFADDSLWLTMLLSYYNQVFESQNCSAAQHPDKQKLKFDAWFHFEPGGAESNRILHHHIQLNRSNGDTVLCSTSPPVPIGAKFTLEKQLFHALHLNHIHSPSIKEFKENYAMANAIRRHMGDEERMQYVIDVAGGHGALAALFLVLTKKCRSATVIDPAVVKGKEGIQLVEPLFWNSKDSVGSRPKELKYRHECMRIALRDELESILNNCNDKQKSTNILVVACHACQHLTDDTMKIASEFGVNVACMPCCQKDHDGWWKKSAKDFGLSIGTCMDLLSAGKMMAYETGAKSGVKYQVKMKTIDEKISPLQNRIILCKAIERNDKIEDAKTKAAHDKLTKAYRRAHKQGVAADQTDQSRSQPDMTECRPGVSKYVGTADRHNIMYLLSGISIGMMLTLTFKSRKN